MGCIVLKVVGDARAYSGASSRYFGKNSTPLVPEYFCPIPEQIVLKEEQIVYHFELLHSGLIASFRNRYFKDQANCKVV